MASRRHRSHQHDRVSRNGLPTGENEHDSDAEREEEIDETETPTEDNPPPASPDAAD